MCGISGFELVVILAAAIIFLGPERLPDMMRNVGKVARELRKLRGDLGQVTREITRSTGVEDLKDQLKESLEVDRVRERVKGAESEIDLIRARLKRQVELPTKDDGSEPLHEGDAPTVKPAAGAVSNDEPVDVEREHVEAPTPTESIEAPGPSPTTVPSSPTRAPSSTVAPAPVIPAVPRKTVMPEEKLAAALTGEDPS